MRYVFLVICLVIFFSNNLCFSMSEEAKNDLIITLHKAQSDILFHAKLREILTANPDAVKETFAVVGDNIDGLSVVHAAIICNRGDATGLALLKILHDFKADFNAMTNESLDPLNDQMNPIAFALYRCGTCAAHILIPVLERYGAQFDHPSVCLRAQAILLRLPTSSAPIYPSLKMMQPRFHQLNLIWSGLHYPTGIPVPETYALGAATSLCNPYFYDLSYKRELHQIEVIYTEQKKPCLVLVFALAKPSRHSIFERVTLTPLSSQVFVMMMAGKIDPKTIYDSLKKFFDLDDFSLIQKSKLAVLSYLAPGFPKRLSAEKKILLDHDIVNYLYAKLEMNKNDPTMDELLGLPPVPPKRTSGSSKLLQNKVVPPDFPSVTDAAKRFMYHLCTVSFLPNEAKFVCIYGKKARSFPSVDSDVPTEKWVIQNDPVTYRLSQPIAESIALQILLDKLDPAIVLNRFEQMRDQNLYVDADFYQFVKSMAEMARLLDSHKVSVMLDDECKKACEVRLAELMN